MYAMPGTQRPAQRSLPLCACLLGLSLHLPLARAQSAAPEVFVYPVQAGDTLIGLQQRLLRPGTDWRVLQRLGRIADPRRMQPGTVLRIPLHLLLEQAAAAEVLHVHGQAWLERPGLARQPLVAATELRSGDSVITGAQSSVSVRFIDGSRSLIGPMSNLRLERLSQLGPGGPASSQIRLDGGQVDTRVTPAQPNRPAPRFELRTPVTNLGVRGTDFRARADADRVVAEVLEGRVAVGTRALDAGFGTSATAAGVAPPRPLLPAPALSAVPERLERLPIRLPLPRADGLTRYRAQVYEEGRPDVLLLDGIFTEPLATWPQSPPDGRYELRVRASDADGVEGIDARRLFTLKARPEPPFLLQPRAGERLLDETVLLAWSRNPEARAYRLQIATNPQFEPVEVQRDGLTATELSLPLTTGRWFWRIASVRNAGDNGPWGDAQSFDRAERPPLPPAPTVLPPRAADAGMVLGWSAAAMDGARYQIQVARDAAFTDIVLDDTTERTEGLVPKADSGTYFVRVRLIAADGRVGSYGTAQLVEVPRSWSWSWLWLLLPLLLL